MVSVDVAEYVSIAQKEIGRVIFFLNSSVSRKINEGRSALPAEKGVRHENDGDLSSYVYRQQTKSSIDRSL